MRYANGLLLPKHKMRYDSNRSKIKQFFFFAAPCRPPPPLRLSTSVLWLRSGSGRNPSGVPPSGAERASGAESILPLSFFSFVCFFQFLYRCAVRLSFLALPSSREHHERNRQCHHSIIAIIAIMPPCHHGHHSQHAILASWPS